MATTSNNRIAKNTLFLYLRMLLVLVVSLYTTRVVLNTLGVEDYGIYNVVAGFVSMFSFLNATMINAVQRFYNFEKGSTAGHSISSVYSTSVLIQLIIVIILLVILETIGLWYINEKMVIPAERLYAANWVFQFAVLSLVVVVLQIPYSSAIMANEKMNFYALVSVADVFLKLLIVVLLPFVAIDKLIFYSSLILLISILDFFCYYLYAKKNFGCDLVLSRQFNKHLFKEMLSFSGWTVLDSIAYTFQGQGLNMLINLFAGPIVNAARGVAAQIQFALQGFSSNIVLAFKPQLTESFAKGELSRVKKLMYSQSKLSYIMLYIFSVPVIIEINYILQIWLKGTVPDYTIPFAILVLINMVVGSLNTPITQVAQAVGDIKYYQFFHSIIIALTLPMAWGALSLGADVVIVFWLCIVTTLLNQIISMILLKRIFEYSYIDYMKEVIIPCAIFTVVVPILPLLISKFFAPCFMRLITNCLLTLVVAVVAAPLGVLNSHEIEIVGKFIPKSIKRIYKK